MIDPNVPPLHSAAGTTRPEPGEPLHWSIFIMGPLFLAFFWAVLALLRAGLLAAARVLRSPFLASFTSFVGAALLIVAAGWLLYHLRSTRPGVVGVVEVIVGALAGAFLLRSLPEGGMGAIVGIPGTVFGITDGIARMRTANSTAAPLP